MRSLLPLLVPALVAACGTDPATDAQDASRTDTTDIESDTADSPDVAEDAGEDAVAPGDAGEDAGAPDVEPEDVGTDADAPLEPDAPMDLGGPDLGPEFACRAGSASTSFGIELVIDLDRCVYSQAELAELVELPYTVRIEASETPVWSRSLDAGGCDRAGASGLKTLERVQGNGQSWCICDEGLCFEEPAEFSLLEPGVFEESIEWDGRNWFGPSDFGNPVGDPFPPGEYLFVVQVAGQYLDGDRQYEWDITATAPLYVTE